MQQIPSSTVASYGQIADLAGLPGRARLVSKALKASPTPLPWYRVVRSNGQLAFAKGSAEFSEQAALLRAEGVILLGSKVPQSFHWKPNLATLLFDLTF